MPLPLSIKRQIEAGQAAFEANLKGEDPDAAAEGVVEALGASPDAEEPQSDTTGQTEGDPSPEASQGDPGPIPPAVEEPGSVGDDELTRARHASASWKGRAQAAKADAAKLARQVEQMTETLTAQSLALAKLQAQLVEAPPPSSAVAPAIAEQPKSLITPEEREQYGEEFSNYIERLAQQIADRQVKQFASQIDDRLKGVQTRVEQFGKRTQQQIEQEFYRDLDRLCPKWRTLNEDAEFNEWLTEKDMYSGDTRKNLLANACEWADSTRAARFFTGFLAEQEALNPGTTSPSPGNGTTGTAVLERMASPGRPRQPATREAPAPEKISEAEARAFFTNVTKGKWRNDPKGKADAIRRIEAALLSGNLTMQ